MVNASHKMKEDETRVYKNDLQGRGLPYSILELVIGSVACPE